MKFSRILLLFIACVSMTSKARAEPERIQNLCSDKEALVFSCTVAHRKIVSVCASPDLTEKSGYLEYRYGSLNKPEISLPDHAVDADWRKQVLTRSIMYSGGGGAYLRFNADDYAYVIYTAIGRGWGEKQGLMVMKGGEMIAQHDCIGAYQTEIGPRLFEQAGLGEDPEELDLP